MSEKRPFLDSLQYHYMAVDEVEKDGKMYKKYKRVPRMGGAVILALRVCRILLIGAVAVLVSYVLINTIFSEKRAIAVHVAPR